MQREQTMPHYHTFYFPTLIRFGAGITKELGTHLKEKQIQRPLIVTDPNCAERDFFKTLHQSLLKTNLHTTLFHEISQHPTKVSVEHGKKAYHENQCDAVIGIGGGTAMDTARAIALIVNHPNDLFAYAISEGGSEKITEEIPYFVTIPTACGTGSEASRSCEISDDATKEKKTVFSPRLMADVIFADPELSLDLPSSITASTGIIALSNNIEAFMSKGFHPMCDGIALEGVRQVFNHLPNAVKIGDIESRAGMMLAAMMGAVAQQKGLGLVHSAVQPLATLYDTPHGMASAVLLPHGLEFNIPQSPKKLQQLSDAIWSHDFIRSTKELAETLELPGSLKDLGVVENDLERLSELAYLSPYHAFNPRPVSQKDFMGIYKKAFSK
jgi:alcohol dehydrogenase class IV